MNNEERDFGADVKINRFQLEGECEKQPSLYLYWAELLADARASVDRAENRLKLTLAEREIAIRRDCEMNGTKATESSVKAFLEVDEKVKTARTELQKAYEVQYHLEAGVKSFEHRKSELDNLVQLYNKGYYARPDGGKHSATDDVSADIRKNLNKKGKGGSDEGEEKGS